MKIWGWFEEESLSKQAHHSRGCCCLGAAPPSTISCLTFPIQLHVFDVTWRHGTEMKLMYEFLITVKGTHMWPYWQIFPGCIFVSLLQDCCQMLEPTEMMLWCLHLCQATGSHGGSLSSATCPMRTLLLMFLPDPSDVGSSLFCYSCSSVVLALLPASLG